MSGAFPFLVETSVALSYEQYSGNGSLKDFAVNFQYLSRTHVAVLVNAVPVPFIWINASLVQTVTAPANGTVVQVGRSTPRDAVLVDFNDGSVLTEKNLDTSSLQVFFLTQEAFDIAGGTMAITDDGSYSAGNRRISFAADPVGAQDVATKNWAETALSSQLAIAVAAKDAAVAAALAADLDADATAADRVVTAADRAVVTAERVTTVAAKVDAQTAKTAAEAARDLALAYRDTTLGYRNAAEGFKNDAAASAIAAALWDPSSYDTAVVADAKYVQPAAVPGLALGHGQCRFVYDTSSNLKLIPFNGNRLVINGVSYAIPAAGVSLASTSLGANSAYYVYAYMDVGVMKLEASATGRATHTDGVVIKSGDPTRTLVGRMRLSGGVFFDQLNSRYVASWFNRRRRLLQNTTIAGTSSTVFANLSGAYMYVMLWSDSAVDSIACVSVDVPDNGTGGLTITVDGSPAYTQNVYAQNTPGNFFMPITVIARYEGGFTEAEHFFGLSGYATTGTMSPVGNPVHTVYAEI